MQLNDIFNKTDLTFELINTKNKVYKMYGKIDVVDINLDEDESKRINKRAGRYITINYNNDLMIDKDIIKVFNYKLVNIMKELKIKKNSYGLVIGLGNDKSTPDSLGPLVIDGIESNNHLYEMGLSKNMRISTFKPSVYGVTGIDTNKILRGIINEIKPDYLIIIDSLVTKSIDRLNNTIQITDAGIEPGRYGCIINKDVYNIPVISIGIPTVLEIKNTSLMVTSNDIDYIIKREANIISSGINKIIAKYKK